MRTDQTIWKRFLELYSARREPESARSLGMLVWRAILVLMAVGIVAVIIYAVTVFATVVENLNNAPASTKQPVVLDRNALDSTIREIRGKGLFLDITPSAD